MQEEEEGRGAWVVEVSWALGGEGRGKESVRHLEKRSRLEKQHSLQAARGTSTKASISTVQQNHCFITHDS